MNKKAILEGMLFYVGSEGISKDEIIRILELTSLEVDRLLDDLKTDYELEDRGLELNLYGDLYKITTKEKYFSYMEKIVDETPKDLSESELECLAVILNNEKISVKNIDNFRGVSSRQIVKKLERRGLIENIGKSDDIGRPSLYSVSKDFYDYFGLKERIDELFDEEEVNSLDKESLF